MVFSSVYIPQTSRPGKVLLATITDKSHRDTHPPLAFQCCMVQWTETLLLIYFWNNIEREGGMNTIICSVQTDCRWLQTWESKEGSSAMSASIFMSSMRIVSKDQSASELTQLSWCVKTISARVLPLETSPPVGWPSLVFSLGGRLPWKLKAFQEGWIHFGLKRKSG